MTTKMFGAPVQRTEDLRLLVGNGRYLDDLGEGSYEAAFVRSPHARARITGSTSPARSTSTAWSPSTPTRT